VRRNILLFLLILFPTVLSAGALSYDLIPADDTHIQYSGRMDFSNPKAPRFDWPGVSVTVRFKGKAVGFRLEDGANNYNLTVDGKQTTVWVTKAGETDCVLAGLSKGEHTAVLSKRTEGYFGTATFKGILIVKGWSLLEPPPKPTRRIEFLGASWLCGYGNEGPGLKCPELRPLENNDLAFGTVAAKILKAEWHITAYSGRGIVRNYGDAKSESEDPYGAYFGRTLVNEAGLRWDFQSWVPDVVVINLGVNDYSTQPQPDPKVFKDRYVELLTRVRAAYPNAWIVAYDATGWPDYIPHVREAVEEFKKKGDSKTLSFDFAPVPIEDLACDYHPNVKADKKLGEDLAARIAGLWDDKVMPAVLTPIASSLTVSPASSDPSEGVWAPGVKRGSFRYDFKGPLDESIWERAKYSLDDVGSYVQPTEAKDGAGSLTLFVDRLKEAVGQHLFTGSGIQTNAFYGYGRFTVRMRSDIKPGTVSSFFLMNKWEPGDWFHKEIDIEFLGKGPKTVQFVVHRYHSNQGPGAMGKPYVYELPFGYGDAFHDYSIHWTKDKVDWSVDGKKVWETTQDIPDVPMNIFMNHWGPGPKEAWSVSWVGSMDLETLPSKAEYQWVSYEPE
jgi:beta-glucanase (GH16 family)/lysophospholipase L1-like esterase